MEIVALVLILIGLSLWLLPSLLRVAAVLVVGCFVILLGPIAWFVAILGIIMVSLENIDHRRGPPGCGGCGYV